MKLKKILTLMCCAVLLVCISVGATVAYLTAQDSVTNTFTVGNVAINLDEAKVVYDKTTNTYSETAERVKANTYKILPGAKMAKDPTVTVKGGSEDCYVRALVTVNYNEAADTVVPANFFTTWVQGFDAATWVPQAEVKTTKADGKITRVYELRYNAVVANSANDQILKDIFTGINLPNTLTNDQIATLADLKINVVANAIQADGFADAATAWAAWN